MTTKIYLGTQDMKECTLTNISGIVIGTGLWGM
jgi:hypothetical protein